MPRYFPVTRTIVETIQSASGVDVQHEEALFFTGETMQDITVVEDYATMGDVLDGLLLVEEDHFDQADVLGIDGSAGALDSVEAADEPTPEVSVPETPMVWVTEPPTLDPDVADLWHMRPRIAEALSDVGQVLDWNPLGVGHVDLTPGSGGTGRLQQVRQDQPNTQFTPTPGGSAAADMIRASNSAISPNERVIVGAWDLSGVRGVRFHQSRPGNTFALVDVANESTLIAPNITLWLGWVNATTQAIPGIFTWDNLAAIRSEMRSAAGGYELLDSRDAQTASIVQPRRQTTPFVFTDALSHTVLAASNLWMALWQDETTLGASALYLDSHFDITLEFSITG